MAPGMALETRQRPREEVLGSLGLFFLLDTNRIWFMPVSVDVTSDVMSVITAITGNG
jgi:hypothetical protein